MRALVVGAGRMGTFHARVLRDLGYDVSTVDPDPARGADYRTVPNGPIRWGFEAAAIACPIEHLALSAWALAHVPRLLVEKPFALNLEDAKELADLLPSGTCVGYVERFNPNVRALRKQLDGKEVLSAHFTRWSDRPSPDVELDLRSHDVDLARYLGVQGVVTYETLANQVVKRREIRIETTTGPLVADLMAHDTSPLHAQWHAFLSGREGPASVADAVAVLEELGR